MTMTVTQVRLPEGLIEEVDRLVNKGLYTNKSDVVRDAIRKLILEKQAGSVSGIEDSVKGIEKLPKEKSDLYSINKLGG